MGTGLLLSSCDNVLDVDYDNVLLEKDYQMDSPNDTIYSMMGILSELESLGERYVVLGELRGDLLEITENASTSLKDIYNFSVQADNPYANVRDYYGVINRCNFLIHNIDTAIVSRGQKVMYKEFAAAKAIRAWTYLQLALNHGLVKYYEQPLTSIQDAEKDMEELGPDALLPRLIADLEPVRDIPLPGELPLGDDVDDSRQLLFPVQFVLGDLYLYNQEYEKAAQAYYDLMWSQGYLSTSIYQSEWSVTNGEFTSYYLYWTSIFNVGVSRSEHISLIGGSSEFGTPYRLDSLFFLNREIAPTQVAVENWAAQVYFHNSTVVKEGDLRGENGSYYSAEMTAMYYNMFFGSDAPENTDLIAVRKHRNMYTDEFWGVQIYRIGLLYLRYAEAVNRAGKPNLAFAVLKNGLTANTLANDEIVPLHEKTPALAPWMDFTGPRFNIYATSNNIDVIGIHGRGNGSIHLSEDFRIPSLPTLQDSILYVEDKIVEELALETAFEGNRFHDLMRVAKRRNNPGYLAAKVAEKHDNRAAIEALLMQESNWYLPIK